MGGIQRISTVIGGLLLFVGVVLFARLALVRQGNLLWIFLVCMMSLLFFNLPAVIQRRLDQSVGKDPFQKNVKGQRSSEEDG